MTVRMVHRMSVTFYNTFSVTDSPLQVALLGLFCDMLYRYVDLYDPIYISICLGAYTVIVCCSGLHPFLYIIVNNCCLYSW